jgi:hypothetical protein
MRRLDLSQSQLKLETSAFRGRPIGARMAPHGS